MITKDSSGNALPSAYSEALTQPSVGFDMRLYANGSDSGLGIKRARVELGAGTYTLGEYADFDIGAVYTSQFELQLYDVLTDIVGTEYEVRVGVLVDGSYTYVTVGYCTIDSAKEWMGITNATGHGRTALLSAALGLSAGDYTPAQVVAAITSAAGVSVALGGFGSTSTTIDVVDGMTCREALQKVALRLGGFSFEDGAGITVSPFPSAVTYQLPEDYVTAAPEIGQSFTVTGIEVNGYSYGDGRMVVEDPTATDATSAITWANIQGYSFIPGSIHVGIADPRVTPADVLSFQGSSIPTKGISLTYDGGYFGEYSASGLTTYAEDAMVGESVSVKTMRAMSTAEQAAAVADAVNQHFWYDSNGAHVTEVTQEEWNDSTGSSYQSGFNSLWNSLGMLFRYALNTLVSLTSSATAFFDGLGTASSNIIARFGSSGAVIGYEAGQHVVIDSNSLDFMDDTTTVATVENSTSYSGMTMEPVSEISGEQTGGWLKAGKTEPFMWLYGNSRVYIGTAGTPARSQVKIYSSSMDVWDYVNGSGYVTMESIELGAIRKVLYNSTSGTNGTVPLSESAADFNHLTIYYRSNDNYCGSVDVYSPDGKTAILADCYPGAPAYYKVAAVAISGTSITPSRYSQTTLPASGSVTTSAATNYIYITRVEGW